MIVEAYAVGFVGLMALFAIRTPDNEVRSTFLISAFWPIALPVLALLLTLAVFKWDLKLVKGRKLFGNWRKPGNPKLKGFAVTLFGQEFQFTKLK
jgi:hypothetical protein